MVVKIIIPLIVSLVLILINLTLIPLISIANIVPNVVLIYLILYSVKNGQISGTLFSFFIGFLFDVASGGLIGSGMFSFTLVGFVAGYFYKEDYDEVFQNIKSFLFLIAISSLLYFSFYSILGISEIDKVNKFSFALYIVFSSIYTLVISLVIFVIPRNRL